MHLCVPGQQSYTGKPKDHTGVWSDEPTRSSFHVANCPFFQESSFRHGPLPKGTSLGRRQAVFSEHTYLESPVQPYCFFYQVVALTYCASTACAQGAHSSNNNTRVQLRTHRYLDVSIILYNTVIRKPSRRCPLLYAR